MVHAQFGANWSNRLGGVRKSRFFICRDFANGKLSQKWAWPIPHNSAENAFALKIAPPAGHFWYVSHRGHSIASL